MIKKITILITIGIALQGCTVYKDLDLDNELTPQAQRFLAQNGLTDKRTYKNNELSPKLKRYISPNGKIKIHNINNQGDCLGIDALLGTAITAGAATPICVNYANICYESETGQCEQKYSEEYYTNTGGWLQVPILASSDKWSFRNNAEQDFNNSIITSINKMVLEQEQSN